MHARCAKHCQPQFLPLFVSHLLSTACHPQCILPAALRIHPALQLISVLSVVFLFHLSLPSPYS